MLQELSLAGSEPEQGQKGRGQGGASRRKLFLRDNFIVTNLTFPSRPVVRFNNKRGTAEQWIKEGKQATR